MALKFGTSGIRGLNVEFTPVVVTGYVSAFLEHATLKLNKRIDAIAIAGDLRESTPGITYLIINALSKLGCEPIDCGKLPTPALALFCMTKKIPGIMITGSHIPADRNGIKFYWPWGEILKEDEIAISQYFDNFMNQNKINPSDSFNNFEHLAKESYIRRYIDFFSPYKNLYFGKTVVVYQHSTVARDLWKPILQSLGFKVHEVGRSSIFTPVDTETDEALNSLSLSYDFSPENPIFAVVSNDGDGDRPLLCDENLKMVRGDTVGILSAEFLEADIVVTPVSTNTALENSKNIKKTVRTKIGSPFVIEKINQLEGSGSIVGFEANGGFLLGSDIVKNGMNLKKLPTRDSILPVMCCLTLACQKGLSLSALVDTLPPRFTDSGLLREFPMELTSEIYQEVKGGISFDNEFTPKYGKITTINEIDGLRITFSSGNIIHFRPSGNAPEFRCYSEATSVQQAKQLVSEGLAWLQQFKKEH